MGLTNSTLDPIQIREKHTTILGGTCKAHALSSVDHTSNRILGKKKEEKKKPDSSNKHLN